jgi:signal transduction histidine kinase
MERAFDRVLLARHFGLSVGAIAAYLFRAELAIGYVALWIVGISATLNFLAYAFGARPSMARICMGASPVIGVGGWTALIAVTGGVASPFIAGLWLEIVLSAMSLSLRHIVLVSFGSIIGLWCQQAWLGIGGETRAVVLQSGFMAGMGLATYLVTRRWIQRQSSMVVENDALDHRLGVLTQELEDERTVAALGENVARLAHGIKNTVHSLRGFVRLIEPQIEVEGPARSALAGLHTAIDNLEALARNNLVPVEAGAQLGAVDRDRPIHSLDEDDPPGPTASPGRAPEESGVLTAVERAVGEVSRSHPGVDWTLQTGAVAPRVTIPTESLAETLVILLRNAVEAMQGEGRGMLETEVSQGQLKVRIGDEGPGLSDSQIGEIFKPGFTTKDGGSGYGLFLARRIAEEHGGSITARARAGQGALFELTLPVAFPPNDPGSD